MEQIAISKFNATCLAVLQQVRKTGKPVLVTRFGKPVATIEPPPAPSQSGRRLGRMAGTMKIVGDIIGPTTDTQDWEVLRD